MPRNGGKEVIKIAKKKETWDASNFEELEELLQAELNLNGEAKLTPIQFITKMLARRERQRLGDKRRNLARAAILEHVNSPEQAEMKAEILKKQGLV